jgi:hypothetical protein
MHAPIFFSPGAAMAPVGRFDSTSGSFGVLYAAMDFEAAFVETILRNPARQIVSMADISSRSVAALAASRPLRMVNLHGAGLQTLGVDNAITTGPYGPCGLWADALFAHPDAPDGIAYASRHDPELLCLASFARPDTGLRQVGDSTALMDLRQPVGAALRRYGKGLEA